MSTFLSGNQTAHLVDLPKAEEFLNSIASLEAKAGGSFTPTQARAIYIVALTCACISLLAVLVALRWFLLMRRSFRHRLVMFLIISDTCKAFWYFVFPVVVFVRGPVQSHSNFCQASGFLLLFAIESSDMAIFIIALHSIIYIMKPTSGVGEGGLYRWRNWIYLLWLGPPLLAASLAFVNTKEGYVTAGTFCYLPKRPFWYRLALSWVPRYLIISMILIMYIWIYVYVHHKFRGFENLGETDSSYDSKSRTNSRHRSSFLGQSQDLDGRPSLNNTDVAPAAAPASTSTSAPTTALGSQQQIPLTQKNDTSPSRRPSLHPWDNVNFITSRPLQGNGIEPLSETEVANFPSRYGSLWSDETQLPSGRGSVNHAKLDAADPPVIKQAEDDGAGPQANNEVQPIPRLREGSNEQVQKTRAAIRKQLRYLFIYPLVYILMWSFPFAAHALNYNDYYVAHPIFWLSMVQTISLALQACVDSVLFSWREKPWRKIEESSKFSIPFLRRQSKAFIQKHCPEKQGSSQPEVFVEVKPPPVARRNPHWWEAEGRRRNDSVWMGTSTFSETLSPIVTRTRTRSRSPDKPATPKVSHSRTRSSEPNVTFVPVLEPISPGLSPGSTPPAVAELPRRATLTSTLTSTSTYSRKQRNRLSLQTSNLSVASKISSTNNNG